MFSEYCSEPFVVEPVLIKEADGTTRVTPNLSPVRIEVEIDYLNECCGLNLSAEPICRLLEKMAYTSHPLGSSIEVFVPPTRPDVLHACDIVIFYTLMSISNAVLIMITDGRCRRSIWLQQITTNSVKQVSHCWQAAADKQTQ